ncbi:MAG: hypothetical protein WDL87_03115 [Candidatus Omnitrophota bacterium]|jgi:DNA repair exonuclease SbcCD ATPase subunit
MAKEKQSSSIVYALADYKQLVLAYKTKYTELVKKVTFWRTSALWFILMLLCASVILIFELANNKNRLAESKSRVVRLDAALETMSQKLDKLKQELVTVNRELENKDTVIKQLEQNVSNTSKKLLEKLLTAPKNNQ